MKQIISTDGNNILFGHLDVNKEKKEELKEFRDYLMGIFDVSRKKSCTTSDLFKAGYYLGKNNDIVKKEYCNSFDVDGVQYIEYNEYHFYSKFLNTILIFNSLLGEIDIDNYDLILTKLFIEEGIFKCDSLDNMWEKCLVNLLNDKRKNESNNKLPYDYTAFKCALDDGVIEYTVGDKEVFSRKDSQFTSIFRSFDKKQLDEIMDNSDILFNLSDRSKNVIRNVNAKKRVIK